jgi:kanamycin kinase
VAVPDAVSRRASGRQVRPVWRNELGGITFAVGDAEFVKWHAHGVDCDLGAEADRLRWLAPHARVPEVLDTGTDDQGSWLATAALPGTSAVDERWKPRPAVAVRAIAGGLRRFHDTVPVAGCPFDWSVGRRLSEAEVPPPVVPPPVDRLVVCHGDACAPNTLLAPDGSFLAHVDVGRAGTADRWADIAVATWSLEWNYGPGWDEIFQEAYGVDPDAARTAYYRLLWEA